MVNVPSGVWIDEQGRIVRPVETAYTTSRTLRFGEKAITTQGEEYVAALRDWVARGAASPYAMTPEQIAAALPLRSAREMEADASFRLAVFLQVVNPRLAAKWYARAQELNPDSWNYHRQEWSFTPDAAGAKWLKKFQESGKPYYPPLQMPNPR
jgi:hypothetical protein